MRRGCGCRGHENAPTYPAGAFVFASGSQRAICIMLFL
jgi:hypothetical protein